MSRDKPRARRKGVKEFAVFDSLQSACKYAEARKGGSHYEVLEHKNSPCHLYFDLDRHDKIFPYTTIKRHFTCALEMYADQTRCGQAEHAAFRIISGQNAQFSDGTRENKTSMHVRLDVVAPSVVHVQNLTNMFSAWILERTQEYPSLVERTAAGVLKGTILDTNVHSNFQNFRMLHMTKNHDDSTILVPDVHSSPACLDHTIGCYTTGVVIDQSLVWLGKPQRTNPFDFPSLSDAQQSSKSFLRESEYVNSWDGVRDHFPVPLHVVAVSIHFPYHTYKLAHETICPYAGRAHQRNNVYLKHNTCTHRTEVRCHDSECKSLQAGKKAIVMDLDGSEMIKLHDEAYGHIDLHTQQDNILWDEEYSASKMRPLPVKKIVCVRAGMGIGKTVAIKALLEENCEPTTKVLCVTFSRALAAKLHIDFEDLGFKSYLQERGDLNHSKIVVCLDSLHRVSTSNFDFVILDEAISVFLHFNSSLMQNRSRNSWKLELFIRQCERATYFVDAALDTTFMMNIVGYFSKALGCKPYWIRNKYIRESSRKAIVTTCETTDSCVAEESIVTSAIMKVKQLLEKNQKVVVCSSTKSFTETLAVFIEQKLPKKRFLVYNSARSKSDAASLDNVNETWIHYDLLIYSPSVSAGVSFTAHHYDSLVAYLVNSRYTPSVDLSLQQLFRVRNLSEGTMHIHVHNKRPHVRLPHTVKDIERCELNPALEVSSSPMYYEAGMMIDPRSGVWSYDRDRLSYHVLLGIKLMNNKSAMFYNDLLCSTLKEDYDICITQENVKMLTSEEYDIDIAALQGIKTEKATVSYKSTTILTDDEYFNLKDNEEDLTESDMASMKLYVYYRNIYGIPIEKVDEKFYETYVAETSAYDTYCKDRRFRLMCSNDLTTNKGNYIKKMNALVSRDDYNLDLHKKLMSTHHKLLLTAQTFLGLLLTDEELDSLKAHKTVLVKETLVKRKLEELLEIIRTGRFYSAKKRDFLDMFQIKETSGTLTVLRNVLKRSMGLDVRRPTTNPKRAAYDDIYIKSDHDAFRSEYGPTYPTDSM